MDPVTVLGAAAASAQFVGYAVKGLLGAAKLLQDVKDAPSQVLQLFGHVEREVSSVNRLLQPDSPVYSHLSIDQCTQLSPFVLEAQRALEDLRKILLPLGTDLKELEGKSGSLNRIARLWKSTITVKLMKEVETDLKVIERLKTSLILELNISGFATQSLLHEQSAQISGLVTSSSTRIGDTFRIVKQTHALQAQNSSSIDAFMVDASQKLDAVRQDGLRHRQILDQGFVTTNGEIARIRESLGGLTRQGAVSGLVLSRIESKFSTQNLVLSSELHARDENMKEFMREQSGAACNAFLVNVREILHEELMSARLGSTGTACDNIAAGDSTFEINVPEGTATLSMNSPPAHPIPPPEDASMSHMPSRIWRCRCRQGKSTQICNYGPFGFRVERQGLRMCPVHGKPRSLAYSIEAQLSPWLNGALAFTLGVLNQGRNWSILRPLTFHGTVSAQKALYSPCLMILLPRVWKLHLKKVEQLVWTQAIWYSMTQ